MLGYRDRQAHKSRQREQQFVGSESGSGTRIRLPAPKTMNLRDNPYEMPPTHAPVILDAFWSNGGLRLLNLYRPEVYISSSTSSAGGLEDQPLALISYHGSGSTSAEMWAFLAVTSGAGVGSRIHNVGEAIDTSVSASTSSITTLDLSTRHYDYTVFNKTVIAVNGNNSSQNLKWTRASGWDYWSATCSGASSGIIAGISQFKDRLIGWEKSNTRFWYGSTDETLGTLNPFELGGIIQDPIKMFIPLSKDGGAGPDDYALFISDSGEVAMYQGNDPAAANPQTDTSPWSLVGVFKIGRPLGVNSFIVHGNQTVVLCQDDFYFLPQDIAGKKQATLGADDRHVDTEALQTTNAIHYSKENVVLFSDGSLWSGDGGQSYSNITLSSADPWKVRQQVTSYFSSAIAYRPILATYKGAVYCYPPRSGAALDSCVRINRIFPPVAPASEQRYGGQIRTAPIKTQGRTNISLVNPIVGMKDYASASTSAYGNTRFTYRTGVLYDTVWQPERKLSLDSTAEFFVTTSCSSNSIGQWTPAFGTGDDAQIIFEMLSGSADDQKLMLYGFDLIAEDTGGM